jgi:hypothetical protein
LAGLAGVRVAGKTGTAQVLDREAGRYSQTRYTAWFIGVVPADDPRIAIVVALDEPAGTSHTGGGTAAPLFARIAAAQLAHQGILTEPEPIPADPDPSWKVALRARELESVRRAEEVKLERAETAAPSVEALSPPPVRKHAERGPAPSPAHDPAADFRISQTRAPVADRIPVESPAADARHALPGVSSPPRPHADQAGESVFVPDFRGQSLASAQRMAAHASLDLQIKGSVRGRVVRQVPVAGTVVIGSRRTVLLAFSSRREEG